MENCSLLRDEKNNFLLLSEGGWGYERRIIRSTSKNMTCGNLKVLTGIITCLHKINIRNREENPANEDLGDPGNTAKNTVGREGVPQGVGGKSLANRCNNV